MTETGLHVRTLSEKLKNKSFMLKGTFRWGFEGPAKACIVRLGGTVTESVTPDLTYLVAEGRGSGDAKKQAERSNKAGATIRIISEADLCAILSPSRDEALALLNEGPEGQTAFNWLAGVEGIQLNLQNAVLKNIDLGETNLSRADLTGAEFLSSKLNQCVFGDLKAVGFSGCELRLLNLGRADHCCFVDSTFKEAVVQAFLCECDLTGADLSAIMIYALIAQHCTFKNAKFQQTVSAGVLLRESDFSNADLSQVNLCGADLHKSKLTGANLRNACLDAADLTEVDLSGADLTGATLIGAKLCGANLSGADFEGAILIDADLSKANAESARNLSQPAHWQTPAVTQTMIELDNFMQTYSAGALQLAYSFCLEMACGRMKFLITYTTYNKIAWVHHVATSGKRVELGNTATLSEALLFLAGRYHTGKPDLWSVQSDAKEWHLKFLVAVCEAFRLKVPPLEELEKELEEHKKQNRRRLQNLLRNGSEGVKEWNAIAALLIAEGTDSKGLDAAGCQIEGADFSQKDLTGINFQNAKLGNINGYAADFSKSNFTNTYGECLVLAGANFKECDFANARFVKCYFSSSSLQKAGLRGATFEECNLSGCDLRDCDLSQAIFDQSDLSRCRFNEATKFPDDLELPVDLVWTGKGASPLIRRTLEKAAAGPIDFEGFMKSLEGCVDEDRLEKAIKMLKTDRFQLFADVQEDAIVGIVKSQTDADLIYSCRLAADGVFACCSQNLNSCGGLRGALCKHLLVLIIGLCRQSAVDTTISNAWVKASRLQKPRLDKDIMSEILLRYKGAEAGEIDWRPTETLPEDYYAI